MKVKYTPGTPEGLVGKTYTVEIIGMRISKFRAVLNKPMIQEVRIKYKDGKTEWIDGMKFFSDTQTNKFLEHHSY
jgi:protein-L-isoaspartate O-methyltransferase